MRPHASASAVSRTRSSSSISFERLVMVLGVSRGSLAGSSALTCSGGSSASSALPLAVQWAANLAPADETGTRKRSVVSALTIRCTVERGSSTRCAICARLRPPGDASSAARILDALVMACTSEPSVGWLNALPSHGVAIDRSGGLLRRPPEPPQPVRLTCLGWDHSVRAYGTSVLRYETAPAGEDWVAGSQRTHARHRTGLRRPARWAARHHGARALARPRGDAAHQPGPRRVGDRGRVPRLRAAVEARPRSVGRPAADRPRAGAA